MSLVPHNSRPQGPKVFKANISVLLTQDIDRAGVYIPGKQTRLRDVLSSGPVQVRRGGGYCDQSGHLIISGTPRLHGAALP